MTYFETEEDRLREKKAIERFVSIFDGKYQKLGDHDIDYKVFDSKGTLISYVEVKGRKKNIANAYPLPIGCRKLLKLIDKRLNPVVIWACDDGVIYAELKKLKGKVLFSGRPPRAGSVNDDELMAYYDKQKAFKYIRYD